MRGVSLDIKENKDNDSWDVRAQLAEISRLAPAAPRTVAWARRRQSDLPAVSATGHGTTCFRNWWSGPQGSRPEGCHPWSVVMIFWKLMSRRPASAYRALQFYFSVAPSQEGGRKMGSISFNNCRQTLEEARRMRTRQDELWFSTET